MIDNKLRELADYLKLTFPVKEMSEKTGYTSSVVSRYYSNKLNISRSFIKRLEEVYDIDYKTFVQADGFYELIERHPSSIRFMINEIKLFYKIERDSDFAQKIGVTPQTLHNWKARNSFNASKIIIGCPEINPKWIITGKGLIVKSDAEKEKPKQNVINISIDLSNCNDALLDKMAQIIEILKQN